MSFVPPIYTSAGLSPNSSYTKRVISDRDPTLGDSRYEVGTVWNNESDGRSFILNRLFSVGGVVQAEWGIIASGNGGGFPITPFVVGPVGQAGYQTIQSAIDAADAAGGGMVFVQSGTYTENLVFPSGIQISGPSEQSATIVGTHTPPSSGTLNINRLSFESATDIFLSSAAGTAVIIMEDCKVNVTNGYTFNLLNWASTGFVNVFNIGNFGTDDGFFNNTGGAGFFVFSAGLGNGTGNTMTISGPALIGGGIQVSCPVNLVTGAEFTSSSSQYTATFTCSNNSTASFYNDSFITAATPALVMSSSGNVSLSSVVIDSSANPAISGAGAGTLQLTDVSFIDNSNVAGTLTVDSGIIEGAFKILQVQGGAATDFIGQAVLVNGTVTVANTSIAATDRIFISRSAVNASSALGTYDYTISAGASFAITSKKSDTTTETGDLSTLSYFIVREI